MTLSQSALLNKDREARYNARIKRTLDELVPISEKITLLVHASANRAALKGLKTGMRLEEAKRRMGDRTRTGSSGYFTNIAEKAAWSLAASGFLHFLYYLLDQHRHDAFQPLLHRFGNQFFQFS